MAIKDKRKFRRFRIKQRVRKIIVGTLERPRLTIFRSNKGIYAQLINDADGTTLVAASSLEKGIVDQKVAKIEQAKLVGSLLAEKAKEAGVESVVFDRNGYLYHGRVKSLATGAREGGLKF
jgi:large subunit ribosomal protein L18